MSSRRAAAAFDDQPTTVFRPERWECREEPEPAAVSRSDEPTRVSGPNLSRAPVAARPGGGAYGRAQTRDVRRPKAAHWPTAITSARLLEIAAAVSAVALLLAALEFVHRKQEKLAPVLPPPPLAPAAPPARPAPPSSVPQPVADPAAERARAVRAYEQGRVDEALARFQRLASGGDPVGKFMVDLILRRRAGRVP